MQWRQLALRSLVWFSIAISIVPWVIKTFRTKSAANIAYVYQAIYIIGCSLTNAYTLAEGLWPVYGLFAAQLLR